MSLDLASETLKRVSLDPDDSRASVGVVERGAGFTSIRDYQGTTGSIVDEKST